MTECKSERFKARAAKSVFVHHSFGVQFGSDSNSMKSDGVVRCFPEGNQRHAAELPIFLARPERADSQERDVR
jgi:hypothetical protein